jgi:hypothetical protein
MSNIKYILIHTYEFLYLPQNIKYVANSLLPRIFTDVNTITVLGVEAGLLAAPFRIFQMF